jgi:hypothetical protein
MQRKKTNTAKAPKPVIDRKDTLRKKVKQKQEENLKSNLVSSSEEESEEEVNFYASSLLTIPVSSQRQNLQAHCRQKRKSS